MLLHYLIQSAGRRIRLPVLLSPCLYQVFYFVRAIIHALRCSSFSCLNLFMPCIHPCFTSIYASHSFMCRMCDSQAPDLSHRYMHSCVYAVSPSSHVSVTRHCALASFLVAPHVSTTRHYVPCPISSPINVSHTRPHAP